MTAADVDRTLSEADTRAKLIDPTLKERGWLEANIRREETVGAIELVGKKARQKSKGRVDYTLRIAVHMETQPVAVALIEAKAERFHAAHGLDQGRGYDVATRLNVPFVFSSNGHQFVEYDRFTDHISEPKPMSEFPTPAELRQRYEAGVGFKLSDPSAAPLLTPYSDGEGTRRYHQDAAIRAALEKIARAEARGRSRSSPALPGDWRGQGLYRREPVAPDCRRGQAYAGTLRLRPGHPAGTGGAGAARARGHER